MMGLVGLRLHVASYTSLSMVSAVGLRTFDVGMAGLLEILISGLLNVVGDLTFLNSLGLLILILVSCWNLSIHFL